MSVGQVASPARSAATAGWATVGAWATPGLVAAIGLVSALVYLWSFTLRWPLWELYGLPQADYAWLSGYARNVQASYLGAFLLLFGLQYVAYRAAGARPSAAPIGLVLGGQVLFGLLLVGSYPVAALDLYDYLMYGRMMLVYAANPFTNPPSAFPDPLVQFSPWPNEPSVYGPLWQLLSLAPTAVAGGSILAGIVLFKLLILGFFVGCSGLVWRILDRLRPAAAPSGTLLFAWNPLLLFEFGGNGHNDAVMTFFLLLAVLALAAGPRLLVLPLLGAAVLTKVLAVVLAPALLVGLLRAPGTWRARMAWIAGGGALAALGALGLYAPFWEGPQTLHFLSRGNWFTASPPTMLREYLRGFLEYEQAGRLAATLSAGAFGLFTLARLGLFWGGRGSGGQPKTPDPRRPTPMWEGWLSAAHDVTFAYLVLACLWWQPWYLVWLVALAALVPDRLVHDRALLFCYGGVLNYLVFKYIWPVYQPMTYAQIMGISVVLIFGLPLLHLACTFGTARARRIL